MSIRACESLSSLSTFINNIVAATVHFSYLVVSSKLFLSRLLIFAFCASNFPLHPTGVQRQREKWDSEREASGLEGLDGEHHS